jgi:uncharacterized membrane protein
MTILILGLLVWSAAHLFKRAAPDARARLAVAIGDGPSRGVMALAILAGLILIIIGYRRVPFEPVYDPPSWGIHLNNLLMFVAVVLMGAGQSKGRARSWLRHPMLTGVLVWAVAHLLVNGDEASLVLFGWMAVWAVASMALINAREPAWTRPAPGPWRGDLRLLLIAAVLYAVIAVVHTLLGYWPFPR